MSVEAMAHVWKTSRHRGAAMLVLLAIADHAHGDGTGAHPSTATLARMARTTDRNVRRILSDLATSGELVIDRGAGPRRTHEFTIPLVGVQVMPWADARRRPDDSSPRTPMSPEPSLTSLTSISVRKDGSEDAHVPPDKMSPSAPPKMTPTQERRAIIAQAVDLWRTERIRKLGRGARFTDAPALRTMRIAVGHALDRGAEWIDIAAAIYAHADDRFSGAPWKIDTWAAAARADRTEAEHAQRMLEEREDAARMRPEGPPPRGLRPVSAALSVLRVVPPNETAAS